MHLTALPRPENLLDAGTDLVTVVADAMTGHYCFACFERSTLRVRWTQRAPGSIGDPRGLKDYRGRNGLWRAALGADFRHLLDRFQPDTIVATHDLPSSPVSASASA